MKKSGKLLLTVIFILLTFSAILYTSCTKDPECQYVCINGGVCTKGACRCATGYYGLQCQYSKIIYRNNTHTIVCVNLSTKRKVSNITTHDTVIYIYPSRTAEYFGIPGTPSNPEDTAIAVAYTYGPNGPLGSTKDVAFGDTVRWDEIKTGFTTNGTVYINFSVRPDYFFLQIDNQVPPPVGNTNISSVDVNQNYTGIYDTIKNSHGALIRYSGNFTVVNDSFVHNVGYFGAMIGSSVMATDVAGVQTLQYCGLKFSWDQSYLLYVP